VDRPLEIAVGEDFDWQSLLTKLHESFKIRAHSDRAHKVVFLDTFDWRFFKKQLLFYKIGNEYFLADLVTENILADFVWKRKADYRFWKDIPDAHLQEKFAGIQDVRAVIPITTIKNTVKTCEFLNQDEKIVFRLAFESSEVLLKDKKTMPLKTVLKFLPVRGYHDEFLMTCKFFKKEGYSEPSTSEPQLLSALQRQGITPGKYSSKIKTEIEPHMGSRTAAMLLCCDMLDVMRQNEQGIIKDIDIEFLHDFRVTIRRTRALLTQLKGVFPTAETDKFKKAFAHAGRMTNRLRDCDVLLDYREHYLEMLPELLQDGLKTFFQNITAVRRKEFLKITEYINSNDYKNFIKNWNQFLEKVESMPASAKSDMMVIDLAGRLIMKRFKQVIKDGAEINEITPDEKIHELRIDCKKLRYLMEFFAPLYPDQLAASINNLKKLQTDLGDFNDLSVQIDTLQNKISRMSFKRNNQPETAASLGGLIAILTHKKDLLRHNFKEAFSEFSSKSNLDYFETQFGSVKKRKGLLS
jgi:CHAD domain-containing protein